MDKVALRKEILNNRNSLEFQEKIDLDKMIFNKLIYSDLYKNAKKIFIYVSYKSEVDTINIINDGLNNNKDIYVPITLKDKKEMKAIKIKSLNNLIPDKIGILEPKDYEIEDIGDEFDLIIMPGVAFDLKGNRIGYGGGYYDKYLENYNHNTVKVALAYELQLVDRIKSEDHDINIDYLITEEKVEKI